MSGIANQNRSRTFDVQLEMRSLASDAVGVDSAPIDLGDGLVDDANVPGSPGAEAVGGFFPRMRGDLVILVSNTTVPQDLEIPKFRLEGAMTTGFGPSVTLATLELGSAAVLGAAKITGPHIIPFENGAPVMSGIAIGDRRDGEYLWFRYLRVTLDLGTLANLTWGAYISNLTR